MADRQTNTLWLAGRKPRSSSCAGSPTTMEKLAEEAGKSPAGVRELVFYTVKHADAMRMAQTINMVLRGATGIEVVPDPSAQMLVAYANPAESAELKKLVENLDVRRAKACARASPRANGPAAAARVRNRPSGGRRRWPARAPAALMEHSRPRP